MEKKSVYNTWAKVLVGFLLALQLFPPLLVFDVSSLRHFLIGVFDLAAIAFCLVVVVKSKERLHWRVFGAKPMRFWLLLIAFMLISFFQSMNLIESVAVFNRWLIVLICALMTTFLIERDSKIFDVVVYTSIVIAAINVLECIVPYYYCDVHISQRRNLMLNGFYGNKNIFSVALLFKLPFLYYAFFRFKKFWRWFALALVFCTTFCLVILSTRTSFIGLILQLVALTAFIIYRKAKVLKSLLIVVVALAGFACGDWFIEFNYNHFADKQVANFYTLDSRFESITEGNSKGRLKIWHNTWETIKQKPLLGYGIGNHKFAIMKVEAPKKTNWIVSDHAHNDFLEMWSELGIFGLLSYALFACVLIVLSAKYAVSQKSDEDCRWLSFVALLCFLTYFNDAVFNFPAERASCQLYLAIGVALLSLVTIRRKAFARKKSLLWLILLAVVMIPVMCVETSHYISSIRQKQRVLQSNGSTKINYTFEQWVKRMPAIPNVDENCKPVAINTAAMAIGDIKRLSLDPHPQYRKAIDLILSDFSNPYYGLREYRLCNYYYNLPNLDSAIFWANRCLEIKPLCYDPVKILQYTYIKQQDYTAAAKAINDYLLRCQKAKVAQDENASLELEYIMAKMAKANDNKVVLKEENEILKEKVAK
ncbi:MAG: O-antigen ligase family protein [Bacteroidales bacterium]|jgi:O-antigen ligase|nr:O-antigen ligase family protein [Bacteroidales bacterium]